MNKGLAYELGAAELAEKELNNGNLGLDPNQAKVLRKPAYYSRDRQKTIIFDVSIEVFRRGGNDPYLIWIWDCKNYRHRVPVDDVEEFSAKLSQVGTHKTKGTIITPHGFEEGAFEFARSKGIGLWRWIPEGSLVYCMDDIETASDGEIEAGLTVFEMHGFRYYGDFYGLTSDGILSTDLLKLLQHELNTV